MNITKIRKFKECIIESTIVILSIGSLSEEIPFDHGADLFYVDIFHDYLDPRTD